MTDTTTVPRFKKDDKGKDTKDFDPRWTLAMEYEHRGLLRPSQFKKQVPMVTADEWEAVDFPWGDDEARGYRRKDA